LESEKQELFLERRDRREKEEIEEKIRKRIY